MSTSQRFVSLHGFFAIEYPATWTQETDEAGHYLFYQNNGGQGVLRVMVLPNDFEGAQAAEQMLNEVYRQNQNFEPAILKTPKHHFVAFVKEHTINQAMYTVYYWVTAKNDKVVLFAYTIQTAMKTLPVAESEKTEIENMIGTFEFLEGVHG